MFRKATSLFTLAAFVVMSVSCVTVRTKTVVAPSDLDPSARMREDHERDHGVRGTGAVLSIRPGTDPTGQP